MTASFLPLNVRQTITEPIERTSIQTDHLLRVPVPDRVCEDLSCTLGSRVGSVVHIFLRAFPVAKEDVFMCEHSIKKSDGRFFKHIMMLWRCLISMAILSTLWNFCSCASRNSLRKNRIRKFPISRDERSCQSNDPDGIRL